LPQLLARAAEVLLLPGSCIAWLLLLLLVRVPLLQILLLVT
jgi:hypothetical protein